MAVIEVIYLITHITDVMIFQDNFIEKKALTFFSSDVIFLELLSIVVSLQGSVLRSNCNVKYKSSVTRWLKHFDQFLAKLEKLK